MSPVWRRSRGYAVRRNIGPRRSLPRCSPRAGTIRPRPISSQQTSRSRRRTSESYVRARWSKSRPNAARQTLAAAEPTERRIEPMSTPEPAAAPPRCRPGAFPWDAEAFGSPRVAGQSHARVGVGRGDRGGRERLHPRLGVEAGHPLVGGSRAPSRSRWARTTRSPWRRTRRATSAATARRAQGSSARSRRSASSSASASSAPATPAAAPILLAGLRWAVEQGFDVINMSLSTTKSQFAGDPARARRPRVLRADDPRRLGAQHAGRELPVAVLLGDLRRQPRGDGSATPSTTTRTRRWSSSRAASTSRSPGWAAARSAVDRQQLRDAARRRASAR